MLKYNHIINNNNNNGYNFNLSSTEKSSRNFFVLCVVLCDFLTMLCVYLKLETLTAALNIFLQFYAKVI